MYHKASIFHYSTNYGSLTFQTKFRWIKHGQYHMSFLRQFIPLTSLVPMKHKWRACFQNLLYPLRHVTHFHYWLHHAMKKKKKKIKLYNYIHIVDCSRLTYSAICKKWLKLTHRSRQKKFWTKQNSSFVFLYVCICLMTAPENSSYNLELEFVDILCSKFW